LIGWHFLYEGYYKVMMPGWSAEGQPLSSWSSTGYLNVATGPLAGLFRRMVEAGWGPWMDRGIKYGLLLVGLSLMLGLFTRLGCIAAMILLATFYLLAIPTQGSPQAGNEGTYLIVNKNLIEFAAVGVLAAFRTGKIAGIDMLLGRRPKAARQRAEIEHPESSALNTTSQTRESL
jgi:thiosulfate dehydrogenase [quinone] large subunit